MLDIKLIRTEPDKVKADLRKREKDFDSVVDDILTLDEDRRKLIAQTDEMKAAQNAASKKIPAMKKAGEDTAAVMAEMKGLAEKIKEQDGKLSAVEQAQKDKMLSLPNLPDEDVPAGGKQANVPLRTYLEQPAFDFPIKDHVELCESLELVDYKRGVKLDRKSVV